MLFIDNTTHQTTCITMEAFLVLFTRTSKTNSMQQSSSQNCHSPSQKISCLLQTQQYHHHVHRSLDQIKQVHTLTAHFFFKFLSLTQRNFSKPQFKTSCSFSTAYMAPKCPSPNHFITCLLFYTDGCQPSLLKPQLEQTALFVLYDNLFSISAITPCIWKPTPPSTT